MAKRTHNDLVLHPSPWTNYMWKEYRDKQEVVKQVEVKGQARMDRAPDFVRETFASIYRPTTPKLKTPAPGSEVAAKLHGEKVKLPEWKRLVKRCQGRQHYAGAAASRMADHLFGTLADRPTKSNQNMDELARKVSHLLSIVGTPGGASKANKKRLSEAQARLQEAQAEAQAMANGLDGTFARQALRDAIGAAHDHVDEVEETVQTFSWGDQPGAPSMRQDFAQTKMIADKVAASAQLQDIARKAGRLRRIAAEMQRRKSDYAREVIADVGIGADLPRVLPAELIHLAANDPDLEAAFVGRLVERKLGQYNLRGKEEKGKGPIILCEDESGSMSGAQDAWAKAVSMALLDIAIKQRRTWALVHFDSKVSRIDRVVKGRTGGTWPTMVANVPGAAIRFSTWPSIEAGMLEALTHFTGGGTSFQAPLDRALELIKADGELKKADVILVTDGIAGLTDSWVTNFLKEKARLEFKLLVVLIGGCSDTIKRIADQTFTLQDIMRGHEGAFTNAAFGI